MNNMRIKSPIRTRNLAFGWIREQELIFKRHINNIPDLIKYIVLLYLDQNKDEFDAKHCHKNIRIINDTIVKNTIVQKKGNKSLTTIYLTNIVCKSKLIWRFKIELIGTLQPLHQNFCLPLIGIRNCKFEDKTMDTHFASAVIPGNDMKMIRGFGFSMDGGCLWPGKPTRYGERCESGDVIEMILDFNAKMLSYKINDIFQGIAFRDIPSGQYKAALTLQTHSGCKITLLSHQEIY